MHRRTPIAKNVFFVVDRTYRPSGVYLPLEVRPEPHPPDTPTGRRFTVPNRAGIGSPFKLKICEICGQNRLSLPGDPPIGGRPASGVCGLIKGSQDAMGPDGPDGAGLEF